MESFKIENVSFSYPKKNTKALDNINFTIMQGEFVTLCGKSGCGKTTLLRLLKPALSPHGEKTGNIYFNHQLLCEYDVKEQASNIGFVMQNPDNQIVTDKVWHELAFGLESLGFSTPEIRARVSEMASFFGIQNWFHKKVAELSGGQKQLLNLASVMVMQPSVLILDEPTSQLDPIAAQEFLEIVKKINYELGTTVILSEHNLEEAFHFSDKIIVMDDGKIIANSTPHDVCDFLKNINHDMYSALPTPMRISSSIEDNIKYPLTVRDGRTWLERYSKTHDINPERIHYEDNCQNNDTIINLKNIWFRYEKNSPDIIKGLSFSVNKGEIFSILGGNGTGKTTALSIISGINKPYRGIVEINGKSISEIRNTDDRILGVLPQNPQSIFLKKTVYLDLADMLSEEKISKEDKDKIISDISSVCHIETLLDCHPYDLSGGEQQRVALAKILLLSPNILLLDEPTKGLDAHFKKEFANILKNLSASGITIVMVSHDIEFCAEHSTRCAMFFDGNITSIGRPREFFAGKNFYTTSANRMSRTLIPNAVLEQDVILACGGTEKKNPSPPMKSVIPKSGNENIPPSSKQKEKKLPFGRKIIGLISLLLFILTCLVLISDDTTHFLKIPEMKTFVLPILSLFEIATAIFCLLPQKEFGIEIKQVQKSERKVSKRTVAATFLIVIAIPLTIYIGTYFFGNRKYYFISLLIILETLIPFCMIFESKKPQAREIVIISVLCAIAVAGRGAFFMLPQFKPVVALIIISGVCFGGESGFLVGAITGFVSNFLFGQGPWTPWQMFAFGIIGFIAGVLFRKGFLRKTKSSLCIFGFLATFIIYGGIMNPASVIMYQSNINSEMILSSYIMGIPFDLIHALSSAFFLWFISEPMIDKLERIKVKYGLIED